MDTVAEVKQRISLTDFVSRTVKLQKSGRNYRGLCPFHTEKTPSFYVFEDTATWRCFGSCGEGGDIFSFLQKRENMNFREVLEVLAREAGVQFSPRTPESLKEQDRLNACLSLAVDFYQENLKKSHGEIARLHEGQILFTYLHLAPDPEQTKALVDSGVSAIAYESVIAEDKSYPLLTPMSAIAGRLAVQAGASCLEKAKGGSGILIGGVANVNPASVTIIGGGVVGYNAIEIALGMQANVSVLDKSAARLDYLETVFGDDLNTVLADSVSNEAFIVDADLVIGAVLVPGASAPKIISRNLLKKMKPGSVFVDVAIDQGGCAETSRPTTHSNPTYIEEGVLHYCVSNMPGAVPLTSTYALNQATLPYVEDLANQGLVQALIQDQGFCQGLSVHQGMITIEAVADELGYEYTDPKRALI